MRRIPRQLDPVEVRVLGALLEKEQTTPDVYPLTVNALVAACNQRSNRDPVMDVDEEEVRGALGGLIRETLVWRTEGARSVRWRHNLDERWDLDERRKAVVTELLLRGPQTVGELRTRCQRMVALEDVGTVEAVLAELAEPPEPLAVELPREPGQKGTRWDHRVGDARPGGAPSRRDTPGARPEADRAAATSAGTGDGGTEPDAVAGLRRRLRDLERRVEALEGRVPE